MAKRCAPRRSKQDSADLVRLEERMNALIETIERDRDAVKAEQAELRTEFKEEREDARKHRQALRDVISSLSQSVTTLSDRVNDMRPVVTQLEMNRQRAVGIVWALRAMWATIGGAAAWLLAKVTGHA